MKLIRLSSDRTSFKTLHFKPRGLSLIVGDGAHNISHDGSANGVGKTLSLGLVHHCLGAKPDPLLVESAGNWRFSLTFEIGGQRHVIERNGNGRDITLDDRVVSLLQLRSWLDGSGVFLLGNDMPKLSFRSLYRRFARHRREDCQDPIKLDRDEAHDGLLRVLYLLGLDTTLVMSKARGRETLLDIEQMSKTIRRDPDLFALLRTGANPEVQIRSIERDIIDIRERLDNMQVSDDYESIRQQADDLTSQLRDLEKRIAIIDYQLAGISKALDQQPDIDRKTLLGFYRGIEDIFKPESLADFEAVESFHRSLMVNRQARLERDRLELQAKRQHLETERKDVAFQRDERLRYVAGKHALDEYLSVSRSLAMKEDHLQRLRRYMDVSGELENKRLRIRQEMVIDDQRAAEYLQTRPIEVADLLFRQLARRLYPMAAAGIALHNNTGNNKLRYDLAVQIEGDRSDGINAARILCFDWLIYRNGAHHMMGHLWHDNRLFADMDPRPRAVWFDFVRQDISGSDRQYIASINTENFTAMQPHLSDESWQVFQDAVIITLQGDESTHKLLGVQFGRMT
ncbi:DUF2326 domain-containing protein [Leptospirillum ferriphilum]|uniref:DUF2326 domain-containing protein n=1 Tax=Leptospirillum ferriphilum TaxID=178606 RepID=UPI0006B18F22|nr:DUF2326 domain-containing protein [Leptospirillum ferriphilum]